MMYKARAAVYSEIRTKHLGKASTMYNFLMLNPVVRKENARL
jgi:hypothetical protein